MVTPHLGNWELGGLWLSTLGPTTILYQPPKRGEVDDIMRQGRGSAGATLVPTDRRGVAALIKCLKKGETTGILPDMEPELSGGVFAPFFGVPALTMTLIQNLQQRSAATVLLAACFRTESGFLLEIIEPPAAIYSEDRVTSVTALNQGIEQLVTIAPEQYQWEYKRFKKRPPGCAKIYIKG
jgi:KDO2-lipid IV(A) lauroyltransferase